MSNKILLVEDEKHLRQSLLILLTLEGYEVISAEDGSVGVNLDLTEEPDLVICDLRMPNLDGDEVLDILRHDPTTANIPFLCMSADELIATPAKVQALGNEHFLQKPFNRNQLLHAIDREIHPLTA